MEDITHQHIKQKTRIPSSDLTQRQFFCETKYWSFLLWMMDNYYPTSSQHFITLWHQNQLRIYLQKKTNFAKSELMPGHISILIKKLEGYYSCHRWLEYSASRWQSDQWSNLSTVPTTKEDDALQVIWIFTSYSTENIVKPVKVRTWSSSKRSDWPDKKIRGWPHIPQIRTMIYKQSIITSTTALPTASQQTKKKQQIHHSTSFLQFGQAVATLITIFSRLHQTAGQEEGTDSSFSINCYSSAKCCSADHQSDIKEL